MEEKIDFVITWVDGNDPAWRKERDHYAELEHREVDNSNVRFRDWETLRYWFRGVEKFAPWVNKIFFVTWGHVPEWLDVNHPKLQIVKHEDFIPSEYLPTFNSYVIEFYFHRIKGLSDQFVYFNDDFFLLDSVKPNRFFKNGLPCDTGSFYIYNRKGMFGTSVYLAIQLINDHFDKLDTVSKAFSKWVSPLYLNYSLRNILSFLTKKREFCGFFDHHLPQGFLKRTYDEVWKKCENELKRTSRNKFRQYGDVSFWLLRYWQLASNSFSPYHFYKDGAYFYIQDQNIARIKDCIKHQRKKMICLNDTEETSNYEKSKREILNAFEAILPDKCSFER